MKKRISIICLILICLLLTGCDIDGIRKSDDVSNDISVNADKFNVEREIKVYNLYTGEVLYENKGLLSVETNVDKGRLEIVKSIGDDIYMKDFVGLSDNITYIVIDISGTVSKR